MLNTGFVLRGLAFAGLSITVAGAATAASPVGSTNVTVADPAVPRPAVFPCIVPLFANDTFNDFGTRPFSFTPPTGARCQGPWAKVVLQADFSVTAGIQYDRTATIWLDGVNLYFGTTQEPSPTSAPSWHVERDLTDYAKLFSKAGQGQAIIGNEVNSTYTGVIHGSAQLLFFPAANNDPAKVADAVYPLGSDPVGNTVALGTPTAQLAAKLTLPRNIERAYLDVFAQSKNADEFWYTCVPTQYASEVQECGGGNFREAEVSIDGQAAGVAPVYPWIYTGGIDPFLWEPTTGVQTLNFLPYRVDLSPFAGVLSNGSPHQVAVSVAGANNYFSTTAALLVYLDPASTQNTGRITTDTLTAQAPTPVISNTLQNTSGNVSGDILTSLSRSFVIEGYSDTSHGRVYNKVQQTVSFANTQTFTINATTYDQVTDQLTGANSLSQTIVGGNVTNQYQQNVQYPFEVNYDQQTQANGNIDIASTVQQVFTKSEARSLGGATTYSAQVSNSVSSADTLDFDPNFNFLGHSGQSSSQGFSFHDSLGGCYEASVGSLNGVVTSYSYGCRPLWGQILRLPFWYTHPDGSPDNVSAQLGW